MRKTVVVINGPPRAGKDTFVDMCKAIGPTGAVYGVSSVDEVKQAAVLLGWDGDKNAKGRKFLSDLKDLSTTAYDRPLKYMLERIEQAPENSVGFFHIREPDEINRFALETGAITVYINRDTGEEASNHADAGTMSGGISYDVVVDNNESMYRLAVAAVEFMQGLYKDPFAERRAL